MILQRQVARSVDYVTVRRQDASIYLCRSVPASIRHCNPKPNTAEAALNFEMGG